MFVELVAFALINRLGHDDFRTREAVTTVLRRLEPIAQLREVRSDDPEVTHRVRGLLADHRATFRPTKYPVTPWLDMLPEEYLHRQQVIDVYRPDGSWGYDVPGWGEWRWATDRLIDDLIAGGETREKIVRLLDQMAIREMDWIRRSNMWQLKPLLEYQLPRFE